MSAASLELKYRRICQDAKTLQTLVYDPHMLNSFDHFTNECPKDLLTAGSSSKDTAVHVPQLHQALAKAFGATVIERGNCSAFELDSKAVMDSHNVETIGHLKPDIVAVADRYEPIDTLSELDV